MLFSGDEDDDHSTIIPSLLFKENDGANSFVSSKQGYNGDLGPFESPNEMQLDSDEFNNEAETEKDVAVDISIDDAIPRADDCMPSLPLCSAWSMWLIIM